MTKTKSELLALVTEAARRGRIAALAPALGLCKEAGISTDEVMGAYRLGASKASLGL